MKRMSSHLKTHHYNFLKFYPFRAACFIGDQVSLVVFIMIMAVVAASSVSVSLADYNYNDPNFESQLRYDFYDRSCHRLPIIVQNRVWDAVQNDSRMAASLLRLHFHDCIVDGCDASVLLDDTASFKGEKNAAPNKNSLRGFEVIDIIKADLERFCPYTVSCADILALAAREAVYLVGGPFWDVPLGRRDGLTASMQAANQQIPSPIEPLENITRKFTSKGLDLKDLVALSGAHTIGFARCFTFIRRLFNFKGTGRPDPDMHIAMLSDLRKMCPKNNPNDNPSSSSNSNLAPLDFKSAYRFDNYYYSNLLTNTGLLESDQALLSNPDTESFVRAYSYDHYLFANDFAEAMIKLSTVGVLTGQDGQIRNRCASVNNNY